MDWLAAYQHMLNGWAIRLPQWCEGYHLQLDENLDLELVTAQGSLKVKEEHVNMYDWWELYVDPAEEFDSGIH